MKITPYTVEDRGRLIKHVDRESDARQRDHYRAVLLALTPGQEQWLRQRLDAGANGADGVCALRGHDVVRVIESEFGVVHTLGGIYDVFKRLGYSSLSPRLRYRKNDPPVAAEKFVAEALAVDGLRFRAILRWCGRFEL